MLLYPAAGTVVRLWTSHHLTSLQERKLKLFSIPAARFLLTQQLLHGCNGHGYTAVVVMVTQL